MATQLKLLQHIYLKLRYYNVAILSHCVAYKIIIMKKNNILYMLLFALISTFANCKKNNTPPEDQLPPATQTGANTFGCLVNGVVLTNIGYDGNNSNYRLFVDPTFQNGSFQIRVYSFKNSKYEKININSNDINNEGTFDVIGNNGPLFVDYNNENGSCNFNQSSTCYLKGRLKITRYDILNGIFSGTFQFNMKDPNFSCDTIRITDGRFDKKL
jgi:hypothetical protein